MLTSCVPLVLYADSTGRSRQVDYGKGGTVLYKAIEQRQWKSVLSRMNHAPHEVSTYVYRIDCTTPNAHFHYRVLPLHCVCLRQPPVLIVSALIAAFSEASSIKCDGNLPLHFALKYGASLDVIQTLILAYPKGLDVKDENDDEPLAIFEANKSKWSSSEIAAIYKVLKGGVDSIELESAVDTMKDNGSEDVKEARPPDMMTTLNDEGWKKAGLTVIIIGASGDLAKKKTFPSLLHLYDDSLLPEDTIIWGYARSHMTHEELRIQLRPFLEKTNSSAEIITSFLSKCFYKQGGWYGDTDAYADLNKQITENENKLKFEDKLEHNRLFYFAIPPNVFEEAGVAIKQSCIGEKGWTRVIVEKPFGRDLQSCEDILATLSKHFNEDQLFRIDHYLGKEIVQNLLVLRFGNLMFERLWNRDNIQCVILTFKKPFGTDGRGGYFGKHRNLCTPRQKLHLH